MVQSHLSQKGRSKALYFTFYRWKSFRDFNPRSPAVRHQTGEGKAQKYYPGVRQTSLGTLREPCWLLRSHKDPGICILLRDPALGGAGPQEANYTAGPYSLYPGKVWLKCILKDSLQFCRSFVQWCSTLCNPRDCSPPGSSVRGSCHAAVLEWAVISSSRRPCHAEVKASFLCLQHWQVGPFPPGHQKAGFITSRELNSGPCDTAPGSLPRFPQSLQLDFSHYFSFWEEAALLKSSCSLSKLNSALPLLVPAWSALFSMKEEAQTVQTHCLHRCAVFLAPCPFFLMFPPWACIVQTKSQFFAFASVSVSRGVRLASQSDWKLLSPTELRNTFLFVSTA